jgi:hypothetical protein
VVSHQDNRSVSTTLSQRNGLRKISSHLLPASRLRTDGVG